MAFSTADASLARAERAFRQHLSLFTDPTMTREAYASLLTEDAVHEYPYAPAPFASRLEGRAAITTYIADVTQRGTNWHFTDLQVTATPDPDTVLVEFTGGAFVPATGKTYHQIYVGRLTMRGEQIARYREYWNPSWIMEAFVGDGVQ
ncbi:nuclear transport factor 2 family protein [Hymenobacter sp. APR13]|uniref:nuclear transport factor 2 family protein n=1 Tax=Hymenobacter sp. APR13 TaxID=1356852 RepID=UPI0004E06F7A|nr:nuclear transport factor 2 family protein [Hymenobacter sp. APR13]AII54400.1 hypothetical protein N008_20735 [Hymenobacter sp. APR13]